MTVTFLEVGHNVTLISPSLDRLPSELQVEDKHLRLIQIGKPRGPLRANQGITMLLKIVMSKLKVAGQLFCWGWRLRADVYHCNEVDSWIIGILLKFLLRKRVVFDIHEYYPSIMVEFAPQWSRKRLEKVLQKLFILGSMFTDGAIFVNQSLADLYGLRCAKTVVRNFLRHCDVDNTEVSPIIREKYKSSIVLLHVGLMRRAYGSDFLIKAMACLPDLPDLNCVILGGVNDSIEFQSKVLEFSLTEKIEVIEQMPFEQVTQYLRVSDIGIIVVQPWRSSFVYSLARKFLEYIAFGLPVIASDFPEMRRIVNKYDLGLLVDPEDPEDIARAIRHLVQNPDLRQRLGRNSQAAFNEVLNWEMESKHLFDLYDLM